MLGFRGGVVFRVYLGNKRYRGGYYSSRQKSGAPAQILRYATGVVGESQGIDHVSNGEEAGPLPASQ